MIALFGTLTQQVISAFYKIFEEELFGLFILYIVVRADAKQRNSNAGVQKTVSPP